MDDDGFPVPVPEGAEPDKPKRRTGAPPKGTPEAKAWARKMVDARAAKRAEREGGASPSRSAASTVRSAVPTAIVGDLESELVAGFTKLGLVMVIPAPIPGTYMLNTSADVAGALARLAARNPKLLAALQGTSNIMDYVALGAWGLGLGVSIAVQAGRMPADGPAAKATGVSEIADELYPPGSDGRIDEGGEPTDIEGGAFAPFEVPIPPDLVGVE